MAGPGSAFEVLPGSARLDGSRPPVHGWCPDTSRNLPFFPLLLSSPGHALWLCLFQFSFNEDLLNHKSTPTQLSTLLKF